MRWTDTGHQEWKSIILSLVAMSRTDPGRREGGKNDRNDVALYWYFASGGNKKYFSNELYKWSWPSKCRENDRNNDALEWFWAATRTRKIIGFIRVNPLCFMWKCKKLDRILFQFLDLFHKKFVVLLRCMFHDSSEDKILFLETVNDI